MIYRVLLLLLFTVMAYLPMQGQLLSRLALDSVRTFRSMDRALKDPAAVYRLDLSGQKLKQVPEGIRQFTNLNALDLGRNKIKSLPPWFGELVHMQELRIARNKLVEFPGSICAMVHLKRLDMSRNALVGLPPCIGQLTELVSMDLWSNDLVDFPEEMEDLKALRYLDLRAIQFEQPEMDRIEELVPRAKVQFSAPCNCGY
jgi:Leucine-rich repeat (LRR) protein